MVLHVSPSALREELTWLWQRIAEGQVIVVKGRRQPAVLLRPLKRGDQGRNVPITRFRRQFHRILREVQRQPAIVTVDGEPCFWAGPDPAELPPLGEDWRLRVQRAVDSL